MIRVEQAGNIDVVTLEEDTLNALISERVKDEIRSMIEGGSSRLIFDLSNVRYIDSSGFGCLLYISRTAKNSYGIVKYCSISPEVMKVLELLHLDTVFSIWPDRKSCIESF